MNAATLPLAVTEARLANVAGFDNKLNGSELGRWRCLRLHLAPHTTRGAFYLRFLRGAARILYKNNIFPAARDFAELFHVASTASHQRDARPKCLPRRLCACRSTKNHLHPLHASTSAPHAIQAAMRYRAQSGSVRLRKCSGTGAKAVTIPIAAIPMSVWKSSMLPVSPFPCTHSPSRPQW